MTLEQARQIAVCSVKQVLTDDDINQDALDSMTLKNDKLKGKKYHAVWINRLVKCKLKIKTKDIDDENCPLLVRILAA